MEQELLYLRLLDEDGTKERGLHRTPLNSYKETREGTEWQRSAEGTIGSSGASHYRNNPPSPHPLFCA